MQTLHLPLGQTNILHRPYKINGNILYKLANKIITKVNILNCEYVYLDFKKELINKQIEQIYKNVKLGIETNNDKLINKYFHANLLTIEKNSHIREYINSFFKHDTYDWKIVHCRTLYAFGATSPIHEYFSQITMQYKYKSLNKESGENSENVNYMVLQRCFAENISFHSWKIFVLDYSDSKI